MEATGPTALANGAEPTPPAGLTTAEHAYLRPIIELNHSYPPSSEQCSSLLSQRISAPARVVWSIVRRFDHPQTYKHFIRSCYLKDPSGRPSNLLQVGCLRELSVISGLPASTSTERLDILDEDCLVFGFTIIGGEHRLRNYRSVTSVNEVCLDGEIRTIVLESYVVDVPDGNTVDDTKLFADTVIRLNLQKLASLSESIFAASAATAGDEPSC